MSLVLTAGLCLCLVGCRERGAAGTGAGGKTTASGDSKGGASGGRDSKSTGGSGDGGSSKSGQASGTKKQAGSVAFIRDGNVVVRDLATGKETDVTSDGTADGEIVYGCPTFVDAQTLMFVKGTTTVSAAGWRILRATIGKSGATVVDTEPALGLGYTPKTDRTLYLQMTGEGAGPDEPFGAELSLVASNESRGTHITNITSWYGDVTPWNCRIRMSPEETMVSVPGFPTDVSDEYTLVGWDDQQEKPLLKDEWLGQIYATGIAFAGTSVYATFADATGPGETPPLAEGLYRVDLKSLAHKRIAELRGPSGLAASEALGIAITQEDPMLVSVDLATGAKHDIADGEDPDVFPR
jgi:hypothetical protein